MKKTKKLPKSIRPEEFKVLIKNTKTQRHKIAFLLAYGSGLRISEVLRCKGEHFRGKSLFVPESKYGVERVVPVPKGWRESFQRNLPILVTARALQKAFKKYSPREELTFHSLRHGFATRCIEGGVPLNQVQVLLGHSNIATTNVYVRANPLDAIKSYEDLF
jgi:integrase